MRKVLKAVGKWNGRCGTVFDPGMRTDLFDMLKIGVVSAVVFAFFLAILEPGGPIFESIFHGWFFWSTWIIVAYSSVIIIDYWLIGSRRRKIERIVIEVFVASLMVTPVALLIGNIFGVTDPSELNAPNIALKLFGTWTEIIPEIIISATITFIFIELRILFLAAEERANEIIGSREPLRNLLPGVPERLGNDIISMSAEEHYTRIVTTLGATLISSGLSECLQAIESYDGVQTHRSHWISADHVVAIEKKGSSFEVVLSNQERVPLSRRRYSESRYVLRSRFDFS